MIYVRPFIFFSSFLSQTREVSFCFETKPSLNYSHSKFGLHRHHLSLIKDSKRFFENPLLLHPYRSFPCLTEGLSSSKKNVIGMVCFCLSIPAVCDWLFVATAFVYLFHHEKTSTTLRIGSLFLLGLKP